MSETRGYLDATKCNLPLQGYLNWASNIGTPDYRVGIYDCYWEMRGYRDACLNPQNSLETYTI